MIHKKKGKKNHLVLLTILAIVIYGIYAGELQETFGFTSTLPVSEVDSRLKVYYLDVGQADAILIQNQEENMLIDAGNNADGHLLVEYFKELGIKDFRYVVGTHPHEDHIGGLDDVILAYPIDTLYLPDAMTTTKTFEDVLNAMEKKILLIQYLKYQKFFR